MAMSTRPTTSGRPTLDVGGSFTRSTPTSGIGYCHVSMIFGVILVVKSLTKFKGDFLKFVTPVD